MISIGKEAYGQKDVLSGLIRNTRFSAMSGTLSVSCLQVTDLAKYIQTKKDMGCRASHVQTIKEGVNTQDTQEFWKILGGNMAYQGDTFC